MKRSLLIVMIFIGTYVFGYADTGQFLKDIQKIERYLDTLFGEQPQDVYTGIPHIIDGDTLTIRGIKIRLYGIDAPETNQSCKTSKGKSYPCGKMATDALKNKIGFSSITCYEKNKDQYQRVVAICELEGIDLNEWLVNNGYAVAYPSITKAYTPNEIIAKQKKLGIWAGSFEKPWDWRKRKKHHT